MRKAVHCIEPDDQRNAETGCHRRLPKLPYLVWFDDIHDRARVAGAHGVDLQRRFLVAGEQVHLADLLGQRHARQQARDALLDGGIRLQSLGPRCGRNSHDEQGGEENGAKRGDHAIGSDL